MILASGPGLVEEAEAVTTRSLAVEEAVTEAVTARSRALSSSSIMARVLDSSATSKTAARTCSSMPTTSTGRSFRRATR